MNHKGDRRAFLLFLAPNLILFAVFTYWPLLYTGYLSLLEWRLPAPSGAFAGLENYRYLATDPNFWRVLRNTVIYAVTVVAAAQLLALPLAILLNRPLPGQALFRAAAFMPYVTTTTAAALVWVLILDPQLGPLSVIYNILGIDGPRLLATSALALWAIIIVGLWREIAIATLFYRVGLLNLPAEPYEAAAIDGANAWTRFVRLTLPLLTPVIFFLTLSGAIAAVKVFDLVAVMTEGGPVYPASSTYVYHLYQLAFRDYRLGYASAFAMTVFIILAVAAALQLRAARAWVHHEH